jgi:hypothetical protein
MHIQSMMLICTSNCMDFSRRLPLHGISYWRCEYTVSMVVILQCLANYLISVRPENAASLFAGNDFM